MNEVRHVSCNEKGVLPDSVLISVRKLYPMMIVPGIVQVLAAAVISEMMRQMVLDRHHAGMLQTFYFAGMLTGILLLTLLMQRTGVKKLFLSSVFLLSFTLLAAAISPWYPLVLAFYLITGFANGILITLPGVYITSMCGASASKYQSLIYGFFAAGFVLGPAIPALVIRLNVSWRWAFALPAMLALLMALPLAFGKFEEMKKVEKLSVAVMRDVLSFNRSLFLGLLFSLLFLLAAQTSVKTWLVSFLEEEKGLMEGAAHLVLMGMALFITLGRIMCAIATKWFKPLNILIFISIASIFLIFAAPMPPMRWMNISLYLLTGLSVAGIYPLLLSYTAWFPNEDSPAVMSVIMASGALGGLIFPFVVGLIIGEVGAVMGMSSVCLLMMGLMVCIFWIRPHVSVSKANGSKAT